MGKNKLESIDMVAKFSNFEVINPEFTRCRCNVFYTGQNRNYSDITEDALNKFITRKGYANVPVVAHLIVQKDANGNKTYKVGGHDRKIILSDSDGFEFIDETVPFGVIPEDCNPSLDYVVERSGEKKKYFSVDLILWTHRYPIMEAAYGQEIYFNQSMEIFYNDVSYDGDYIIVNDFSMSALCLLNLSNTESENVEPCFESSKVRKFSLDENEFKENYELLLEHLQKYSNDNKEKKSIEPNMKGELKMDFTKFNTLLSEIKVEGKECLKYELLSVDESKIYVFDRENGYKLFSAEYVNSDNNLIINWDTKTEGDITFTEKSETKTDYLSLIFQEMKDEIKNKYEFEYDTKLEEKVKEISKDAESRFAQLQENYETLKASYSVAKEKLDKFESIELEKEKQNHINCINETLERFEKKIGKSPEFIYFKAKLDVEKADIDKVEKELTLMTGDILMNKKDKSTFSYTPNVTGVNKYSTENDTTSRYGNLLDGFMN